MHGLTGGSWKRNKDRTRATEMKDTRGNLAVTSGSETYRRCALPRQLSTLLPHRDRHNNQSSQPPHEVNNLTMPSPTTSLSPFPMWPALPASEYYGDSAPSRTDRSTVDPALGHAGDVTAGETRDGSRVHCDSLDRGGARLCPSGLATATPQPVTVASPSAGFTDPGSSPPHIHTGVDDAPLPAHIRQV